MEKEINQLGSYKTVSENEIRQSRNELSRKGVLVEYSSATVYAARKKWKGDGRSLLIMSGNGLKNQ